VVIEKNLRPLSFTPGKRRDPHQLQVDAVTGEWVRDPDGRATLGEGALLLR